MNTTARIQSVAGVATILALPLLYIGGSQRILPLTAIGFAVFAIGMLTTPTLRFIPLNSNQGGTGRNTRPPKHGSGGTQTRSKENTAGNSRVT